MTISTTIIKNSYSGNGSTTAFTYNFKIAINTEIEVIVKTNATGAESIRSLGSGSANYGVSGVGNNSGTVTFVTAPTNLETVVLRRSTAQTQAMDLIDNDPMSAGTIETAHDKAIAISQELQEQLNRSIKISKTNTMTSTEFTVSAADRANKLLAFDASGELSITQEIGTFKGTSATTTTAAYVVRDIVKGSTSAQANNIYICIKASPIGTALTNTTFWVLIVDAVSAATSASTATTKAAEAVTAKNASVVAKDASVVAKDAAIVAKDAAATSATAAASSADAFDDVYLGTKSSDPSEDNDGDALAEGMLYFNSTNDVLMVYTGSAWQTAAINTSGVVTLAGTQTLTNKTLTAPAINTATITAPKIVTSILDSGGNELALLTATGSAVNEFTIANAASGNAPRLSATGETNVDLALLAKGTGHVTVRGNTNSGAIQFNCESNSHGQIVIAQPHSASVTNTLTLPAGASSTLVSLVSTDTLTNKTLTAPKINEDVAVTSTATELNLLDGVSGLVQADFTKLAALTGSAAELNTLTGVTAVVAELNALDLGSTAIGTAIASKAVVLDANKDSTGIRRLSVTRANVPQQALTSGSNAVAWDASAKPNAYHLTTENTTFAAPSNAVEGAYISLEIEYDGSHSIGWNTIFEFAASTEPTETATDGKSDLHTFRYNGAIWQEVGRSMNLSAT